MKHVFHLHIPIVRLILAVIAAEVVPLVLVVVAVAAFGPSDDLDAAHRFAGLVGRWVGPIAGAICAYLAAYGIGRVAPERALSDGIIVGLCLAALDAVLLFAGNASFEWLYLISNAGKIIAATLGGWVSRGPAKPTPPNPLPTS